MQKLVTAGLVDTRQLGAACSDAAVGLAMSVVTA
jgi:hypothetical protein